MFSSAEYMEMRSVSSCFFLEIESVGMILRILIVVSQEKPIFNPANLHIHGIYMFSRRLFWSQ